MADFALGLTKTAVEGTLSRVQSAIEEEARLKVTVQQDLVFITGEFQMMQSFLKVASKERANNEVVKTWVRQLRDLAFDVEDCVEFVVHMDKHNSAWTWLWRLAPSCMAPPIHLDEAAAEIKQLKARVEEVSQRNVRYNLISDSGSKHHVSPQAPPTAAFDILSEVWEAGGKRRCTMDDLQNSITTQCPGRQVISVWESTGGDTGTASILRKVYSDQKVCQEFKRRAWVKLVHPFNPDDFFRSMLAQFCASSQDPNSDDDFRRRVRAALAVEDDVMKGVELMQLLGEQTCLVVLEDVSTIAEWNFITRFLPNNKQSHSRIIVSTKQLKIAILCTGEPTQVLELSHGQSLFAFFNKEFAHRNGFGGGETCRSRLEKAREWTQKIQPVGSLEELYRIKELIMEHGVISVWGIAGLGKSTLVRAEYYNTVIAGHEKPALTLAYFAAAATHGTFAKYSWVDVPNPFNLTEFARRLFLDFHSDDNQAKETAAISMAEGQDPIQGSRKLLDEGKCFVVIDDLRSTDDWDLIKAAFLSHLTSDSTIVVITSEASVARRCVHDENNNMINIKGLDSDMAFLGFKQLVWGDWDLTPEEKKLSMLIAAKCGGLPTIIFAIGKYCYQPRSWLEEKDEARKAKLETKARRQTKCLVEDINNDFIHKLETDPGFHCLQGLFSWMRSYFEACSDSVKPCIFYLSVFPAGSNIRRRRLLRRWIAEGYSRDTPGSTAEENGANLFSELVNLSIIQQTQSKLMCQVNTFLHEYIISRPMEDNLVFALEGCCSPNTQRAGQHLTIRSCWDRDINVFMSIDFSRLRSLTVFGEWSSFFISTKIRMRVLRVLDLEGNVGVTYHDLEEIGKLLPRLKFLSLRGCGQIKQLPNSFGGLRQLQTLDVRHTSIVMLPPAIFQLEKLQYVRAGTSKWHAGDDIITILPVVHGNQTSAHTQDRDCSPMPAVVTPSQVHDDTSPVLPAVDGDHTSTPQQDGDGSLPAAASPRQDGDDTAQILPAVDGERAQEDGDGSIQGEADPPQAAQKNKTSARSWVSWLSKLRASAHNGGVDVHTAAGIENLNDGVDVPAAAGIGLLTALHTLGVINVNGAGGKVILKELNKLTQLRKLGVSGINSGNILDFFSAISSHRHLESMSVRLEDNCLDDISLPQPPKTLKSLKLYGNMKKLPVWIKQLGNLKKLKLELTVSGQEDIHALSGLPRIEILSRLCVKLSQGGKLNFGLPGDDSFHIQWDGEELHTSSYFTFPVLEIDCISSSEVTFGHSMTNYVELLKVHCSGRASLNFSGLETLENLKEIWLMGSFDDTLKQEMQQQLGKHRNKPVLKLVQPRSS